jgi:hypothetical protein
MVEIDVVVAGIAPVEVVEVVDAIVIGIGIEKRNAFEACCTIVAPSSGGVGVDHYGESDAEPAPEQLGSHAIVPRHRSWCRWWLSKTLRYEQPGLRMGSEQGPGDGVV